MMIARTALTGNSAAAKIGLHPVASWSLWKQQNRWLIGYVLAVDGAALAAVALLFAFVPIGSGNLFPFVVLMGCGLLYTEISRPIEEVRERFTGSPHIDLNSVWMFAAVLLLHPGLAALVIATSFAYRWLRVRHHVVHRQTFSAAATVLAVLASTSFLAWVADEPFSAMPRDATHFALIVLTGLVFLACNTVLVTVAVYASTPGARLRTALGTPLDYSLEAATIGLGVLLAWALVAWPIVLVLIVGITLVLHRCVLIRQLREKARTDGKTGLLHAAAWVEAAHAEVAYAQRNHQVVSALMLDLDHFKQVNDTYGHLVGDEVLRRVVSVLQAELRVGDLVGRFGGEEFCVLLPATRADDAFGIAERIRLRVAELTMDQLAPDGDPNRRITISIGVVVDPGNTATLDDLLRVADEALYEAKSDGRNRCVLAAADGKSLGTGQPTSPETDPRRAMIDSPSLRVVPELLQTDPQHRAA